MIAHRRKTNEVIPRIALAFCLEELSIHYEITQVKHSTLIEVRIQRLEFQEAEVDCNVRAECPRGGNQRKFRKLAYGSP